MSIPTSSSNVPPPGAPKSSWYPAPVQVTRDGDGAPGGATGGERPAPTEPVPTFEAGDLFGESWEDEGGRTVVAALPFELKPRFTGRRSVVDRLQALCDAAVAQRELAFVALVGDPGMGKSRLVAELGRAALQKDARTLVLSGAPDEAGTAHAAIARILAARFGIRPGESATEAREKITAGVAEVLPAARVTEVAHLVAHLMRVPFEDSPVVGPLAEAP